MEAPRVTQNDVAKKAGVHRTTVSLALKNHPSIPDETRQRIKRLADKLGYAPDPMLSSLVAYRTRIRPAAFHGTLAWLVNSSHTFDWREVPHFRDYHAGATERARNYGFQLSLFDLYSPDMRINRLAGILKARNISGLLLCPQPLPNLELDFPWQDFSAVTFGYTLAKPRLHTVTATHYRSMIQIMEELQRFGYRRIGLMLSANHDQRTDHNYLAGYLIASDAINRPVEIPPLFESSRSIETLAVWLKQYKPDAIISGNSQVLEMLKKLHVKVPDELGVACPCLTAPEGNLAGVFEDSKRIGAIAVDVLVAMMNRGERGVPDQPQRIHVEGPWNPGRSLIPHVFN